jgi:hypothetical protein
MFSCYVLVTCYDPREYFTALARDFFRLGHTQDIFTSAANTLQTARRIAANIAELPGLLGKDDRPGLGEDPNR